MNRWAVMLGELPALGQRAVARRQRISLPRRCSAAMRTLRLREALCHRATVLATYEALDQAAQNALQDLRTRRGGIATADLVREYGAVRSWRQLAADPQPQSVAEHLVLLGWLLFRPAAPRHPARYLLPPELRRWLPQIPQFACHGVAPSAPVAPALRAATALLLAAAQTPLALRANGQPRRATLRTIAAHLAPLTPHEVQLLVGFLLPLLCDLGLLAQHRDALVLAPAGERFLAAEPTTQLVRLTDAWIASPHPDRCLRQAMLDDAGVDWPLLRRRLCLWASALPDGRLVAAAPVYQALAARFGPLANAQTHGFKVVNRAPWQPRRAAQIFHAALRGPLAWLGIVAWSNRAHVDMVFRPSQPGAEAQPHIPVARWRLATDGTIHVPHTSSGAAVLPLLPFVTWRRADDCESTYQLTRASFARAQSGGYASEALWQTIERNAGSTPPEWQTAFASAPLRIATAVVVTADTPAVLERACRSKGVRRYIAARPAPGVALVEPQQAAALVRALERQQLVITPLKALPPAPVPAPHDLTPGDCATLLMALDVYRAVAGAEPAFGALQHVRERLCASLTPTLRRETERAAHHKLHVLASAARSSPVACQEEPTAAAHEAPDDRLTQPARALIVDVIERALRSRMPIEIEYDTGGVGVWQCRLVRPLQLEQRGENTVLHAFCTLRQDERVFRLDRIRTCIAVTQSYSPPIR